MLRIAVVEDYVIFRLGLKCLLSEHFDELAMFEASHADDYQHGVAEFKPDVLILGLSPLNRVNVFLLTEELRKLLPEIPIIIFDVIADYNHAMRFMRGEANGYLSKMDQSEELLNCIDTVRSGKNYVCAAIQESIIQHMFKEKPAGGVRKELSTREAEIANFIGDGAKTSTIAEKLGLKSSTVSTIKAKIYQKLGVSNAIELRQKIKELEDV